MSQTIEPRARRCAHALCQYLVHSNSNVSVAFCCRRCERSSFKQQPCEHGPYCEKVTGEGVPSGPTVRTPRSAQLPPLPRRARKSGRGKQKQTPPLLLSIRNGGGELCQQNEPEYMELRRHPGGWENQYCLLCRAWVDEWHLASQRHIARTNRPLQFCQQPVPQLEVSSSSEIEV
mmetsp:Transcript_36026/g.95656  ORF Transcript_36026/g.95656 Transcript_36026/m.95656 type:complete len:175 (-) Transcript_36026:175-699(-)